MRVEHRSIREAASRILPMYSRPAIIELVRIFSARASLKPTMVRSGARRS